MWLYSQCEKALDYLYSLLDTSLIIKLLYADFPFRLFASTFRFQGTFSSATFCVEADVPNRKPRPALKSIVLFWGKRHSHIINLILIQRDDSVPENRRVYWISIYPWVPIPLRIWEGSGVSVIKGGGGIEEEKEKGTKER